MEHCSKFQLNKIAEYIAADKSGVAHKWLEKIFRDVENLELFPKSGRKVPEFNQEDIR